MTEVTKDTVVKEDDVAGRHRGSKRQLSPPRSKQQQQETGADVECKECGDVQVEAKRTSKRTDYISWDDYFMAMAQLTAMRSKDPSTQVGACIVNPQNRIVGIGYNGFPAGCGDDDLPWDREAANPLDTKYMYVCHADMNAILNRLTTDTVGCRIYAGLFPCNECAKLIIQSGIREVIYMSDKYHNTPSWIAARRLFDCAGVAYRQHTTTPREITIDLAALSG